MISSTEQRSYGAYYRPMCATSSFGPILPVRLAPQPPQPERYANGDQEQLTESHNLLGQVERLDQRRADKGAEQHKEHVFARPPTSWAMRKLCGATFSTPQAIVTAWRSSGTERPSAMPLGTHTASSEAEQPVTLHLDAGADLNHAGRRQPEEVGGADGVALHERVELLALERHAGQAAR